MSCFFTHSGVSLCRKHARYSSFSFWTKRVGEVPHFDCFFQTFLLLFESTEMHSINKNSCLLLELSFFYLKFSCIGVGGAYLNNLCLHYITFTK